LLPLSGRLRRIGDKRSLVAYRIVRIIAAAAVALGVLVAIPYSSSAATPHGPSCTLSGTGTIQICPVTFKATAGKSSRIVVARYSDFSHCNSPAPSNEPGSNQNYVVASVTINWGDGSRPTSGVAHTGTTCPPNDSVYSNPGEKEPVTGVHRYKKKGTYTVSVSLTYVRGTGDTYPNCATATAGDTTYNAITNCIAEGAPAQSIGVVKKEH
jgi:hypothetical protein